MAVGMHKHSVLCIPEMSLVYYNVAYIKVCFDPFSNHTVGDNHHFPLYLKPDQYLSSRLVVFFINLKSYHVDLPDAEESGAAVPNLRVGGAKLDAEQDQSCVLKYS